ncbi:MULTISPECIES: PTS ascorbate transporter subunit IIC [Clostridium]|jgi:PTS system ascorbate-specific IIC component|uniref:Ascorbate-specific PTS system EIIC component n=2 Tax=Clostridium beijerinckii TaxID=1520 RepID=A0A1S8PEZ8_CLOBE|nr:MULTISPECIES: PTS ascorbate transporter subunit IIC [Clostridium]MBC2456913.1 PTS ascorbate transporter subunit IIC [Clostridium beijerinckii]MBC2473348.1 PTS ascorbate transporter subunit IIC [Clostridium beijerinckii]MCI1580327.1 PTS ascorbate transporter subunit IIC [Clostridium beijerinckii]MCI1583513.1 PTS ascorbate transporter subunit IIC [Clostridium beijerinckii]MCI1623479.1 PTS ascorbate transporter subunit IIC [Clostridium beijerinckii]
MSVLEFFRDVLKQPALLMGIMSFVGLIALKKPGHKIMTGTLKPILGYLMLGAGADFITSNLDPLGKMIQEGFHINGVVPNNEAIVSVAQKVLGVETMTILIVGLLINLLIARFTKFKYVFLTGHHSFFMACLLSAVLGTTGMSGTELILFGGFLLGAWSSISPAIGQRFTRKVTDGDDIALGHFGSLAYYISAWVGSKVGKPEESTEKIEIPEKWGFLRDTTISTALTMMIFYLIAAIAAGPTFVATISDGTSPILFALMAGLKFAVGVTIVYSGVRMILGDLIPAFQGIATRIIPDAVPAVDCAVFFTYAPTAVVIGFVSSFIGGVIGMILLGFAGGVLIIPGLVPHFFCGATAGIFGNATGGRKGAIVGSFVNGLLITFAPALLLPVLGSLGFQNTTFGDFDFGVLGIILGKASELVGKFGIIAIVVILLVVLIVPNFIKTKSKAINNLD